MAVLAFDSWFETVQVTEVQKKNELRKWLTDNCLTTAGSLVGLSPDEANQCSEIIGVRSALRTALKSLFKIPHGNALYL